MYRRKPSQKQVQAIQLINKGLSPRQAMLRAGYSVNVAKNPKQNLLSKSQVLTIVEQMKLTLQQEGIDGIYLGNKLAALAKSDSSKDFIMAYDRIAKVIGIEGKQAEAEPIKRQITLTEYLHPKEHLEEKKETVAATEVEEVIDESLQPKIADYQADEVEVLPTIMREPIKETIEELII